MNTLLLQAPRPYRAPADSGGGGSSEPAVPAAELTLQEFLALAPHRWFPTGKTDYRIRGRMVSADTEIYNALEDVRYTARPNGEDVVLTGVLGENWVTKLSRAAGTYTLPDGTPLTAETFAVPDVDVELRTIPTVGNFACFIPVQCKVAVSTVWGDLLHANRGGIDHGKGDYLVCAAGEDGGPDLSDVWVVNGALFVKNYALRAAE